MIRVKQIKVNVLNDNDEDIKKGIAKKIGINYADIDYYTIIKKSIDARYKPDIFYIYEVEVSCKNENVILKKNCNNNDIALAITSDYVIPEHGEIELENRPVIVGSGPAGLFCAYLLALEGYNPLVIERGENVDSRINTVNKFWETGKLNKESNVQFGEGGAGTFSDGKLNTLTKDNNNRGKFVFETFVSCGANSDILISNMPHIGTDVLVNVVRNLRNKIISLGGEFLYNNCLTDINIIDGKISSIMVNDKIIKTDVLVLAIGHSARDTFHMLYEKGLYMESKPFALGIRIQHPQGLINKSQYGEKYYDKLPPASYKLTYKTNSGRGVYSFCMCPGGYVVNASSEDKMLAINGMSYNKRDSENANSAIVVTVTPDDFGNHPLDGIKYQRDLEKMAYELCDGKIPTQLLGDYYKDTVSTSLGDVLPIFKGGYGLTNLNKLYPDYINDSLKEAFVYFGKKIEGFNSFDSIISGIESRTSSPVRIVRNEMYESNVLGIYPCGEGAGYAGGITTSSIDGIKVAEAIINKYKNKG